MTLLVALARIVVGVMWVVSAVAKLRDRQGFAAAVPAFGIPTSMAPTVAVVLPVVELTTAFLLLLPGPWALIGGLSSLVMLVGFTLAIARQLWAGEHPACHCFGVMSDEGVTWSTVIRNGVFIVLTIVAMGYSVSGPSAIETLADLSEAATWTLVAAVVVAAALGAMGYAVWTLMGRYGATLLRLEALERLAGLTPMPQVPEFDLPDLAGNRVVLDDVLAEGKPALLVFTSPTCTHCQELVPELVTWQSDDDSPVRVLILSEGSPDAIRDKWAGSGVRQVLVLDEAHPMGDYGAVGTPAAVLVGPDGIRAAEPMHAVNGVRSLYNSAMRAYSGSHAGSSDTHVIGPRPRDSGDEFPSDLELMAEDGTRVRVLDATEQETVLLFWRTGCGYCARIVDEVHALEESARVLLVTTSTVEEIRASGLSSPIVFDPDTAVGNWLGVMGTPSAVSLEGGRLTSGVGVGGPDVLALLEANASASAAVH